MTEHVALFHGRNDAVEDVQVGPAYGAGRDLDDRVAVVLDLRVRHGFAADIVLAVPGQRFHQNLPSVEHYKRRGFRRFLSVAGTVGGTSAGCPHCDSKIGPKESFGHERQWTACRRDRNFDWDRT